MERLGDVQRKWILWGLVGLVAVLVLGTVGWSFYSRGKLTRQGIRIQTGLGIGGPGDTAIPPWRPPGDTGNPGHGTPPGSAVPYRPYCVPCGAKGTVHGSGASPGLVKPYDAEINEEDSWKGSRGPSGAPYSGAY